MSGSEKDAAVVRVKGIEEAQRALADIIAGLDGITEESLEKVGKATLDLVKARTPVRTGRLRSGHRMQVIDGRTLKMWNEVEYASFVEFGTSRMAPRPHWRPAIEYLKKELPQVLGQMGRDLVSDAASGNNV